MDRLRAELAARQDPKNAVPAIDVLRADLQAAAVAGELRGAAGTDGREVSTEPVTRDTPLAHAGVAAYDTSGDWSKPASSPRKSRWWLPRRSRTATAALVVVASALSVYAATAGSSSSADASTARLASLSDEATVDPTAVTFTVSVDGEDREITSSQPTLAAALAEAGIVVDADDRVSAAMAAPILNGAKIAVTRVETQRVSEQVTDPHQSSEVEDDNLAKGTKQVTTAGVDGVMTNTYEVTYENGHEVSRRLVISATTTPRVDEVVSVGTKETPAAEAAATSGSAAVAVPAGEAQQIAYNMLASRGWGDDQFSCLVNLWNKESGWSTTAANPSGAYGIPQALPGSKMASAGADWQTNPATQITWGLGYIAGRYGTPCNAWASFQSKGWY
ncbi:G5 domain-containing protein [Arcanobacterium haemolyticum]|nr:G5 domain-containing protein [Arcanobacterium haemolyticum]